MKLFEMTTITVSLPLLAWISFACIPLWWIILYVYYQIPKKVWYFKIHQWGIWWWKYGLSWKDNVAKNPKNIQITPKDAVEIYNKLRRGRVNLKVKKIGKFYFMYR